MLNQSMGVAIPIEPAKNRLKNLIDDELDMRGNKTFSRILWPFGIVLFMIGFMCLQGVKIFENFIFLFNNILQIIFSKMFKTSENIMKFYQPLTSPQNSSVNTLKFTTEDNLNKIALNFVTHSTKFSSISIFEEFLQYI